MATPNSLDWVKVTRALEGRQKATRQSNQQPVSQQGCLRPRVYAQQGVRREKVMSVWQAGCIAEDLPRTAGLSPTEITIRHCQSKGGQNTTTI
ncbi:uncharacterized protein MYCGRDRAFT_102270, partial [Zymoseptoria tritici IPO323]